MTPAVTSSIAPPATRPAPKPVEIIRAETNFLRFPLFALHTRGLRERDAIDCVGRKQINGEVHEFQLSISRNTRYCYPGPLSRTVHFALLSFMQEQGYPFTNPITWTWRELARRMEISCSGRTVEDIKGAIRSTAGVLVTTNYALTAAIGPTRGLLPTDEHGYQLYDAYRFKNELRQDGSIVDRNAVWLSDWYLTNLNSGYAGPVQYPLWMKLNRQHRIASRLYEFLIYNFHATARLEINYATLAAFLPIHAERYVSLARKQLDPVFALLQANSVIADVRWTTGKHGQIKLVISPGVIFRRAPEQAKTRVHHADTFDEVRITEVRNTDTPASAIVKQFHKLWSDAENLRPTKSELIVADELLDLYGRRRIEKALPKVVGVMRREFPKAKTFGATRRYFAQAIADADRKERREREQLKREEEVKAEKQKEEWRSTRHELLQTWKDLDEGERQAIERSALARQNSDFLSRRFQTRREYRLDECLRELGRTRSKDASAL